ncbi:MAG TPA: nuclear transport factor 2 family protein [Flavihumibacter sp.]|jgi:ketosteroid isomerase-like protein
MKKLTLILLIFCTVGLHAQQSDEQAIRKVLMDQQDAWNRGDIDAFMAGYWNSDSLLFIGSSGVTYGYQRTIERYKKTYNSREKMGQLKFDLLHFIPLSADTWMVVGKWHLIRSVGDVGGHYTLLVKRINGKWVIISDHTS